MKDNSQITVITFNDSVYSNTVEVFILPKSKSSKCFWSFSSQRPVKQQPPHQNKNFNLVLNNVFVP